MLVLPQLLESLDAAGFLRSGRVRLTFCDSDTCDGVLEKDIVFDGVPLRLLPADSRLRTVFLRDLPVEISDATVRPFSLNIARFCPWSTVFTRHSRRCKMETASLRFCFLKMFQAPSELRTLIVVCGTLASPFSARFVASLVIVPRPAHSLVFAGAVASPAIWLGSVRGFMARHRFLFQQTK